jgi:hypothetical protein
VSAVVVYLLDEEDVEAWPIDTPDQIAVKLGSGVVAYVSTGQAEHLRAELDHAIAQRRFLDRYRHEVEHMTNADTEEGTS